MKCIQDTASNNHDSSKDSLKYDETATENSERNPFQCGVCDFISKSKSVLTTHVKRKQNIPQFDGSESITEDESETNHTIKITFVSETVEKAKNDIINYYICDLTSVYSEYLEFLEKEYGTVYAGQDHCYNKGDHKEHVFIFDVDEKYFKQDIQNIAAINAVKKFDFINERPKRL